MAPPIPYMSASGRDPATLTRKASGSSDLLSFQSSGNVLIYDTLLCPFHPPPCSRWKSRRRFNAQGLAVLPVLLSICGPMAPPTVLPTPSFWTDTWGDKHEDVTHFSSPTHAERANDGDYDELRGGTSGGDLGWNWRRGGVSGWDSWGEEEEVEGRAGSGGSGRGLSLPPASHVQPGDNLVQ